MPELVIAQVMNMGDCTDIQALGTQVGKDARLGNFGVRGSQAIQHARRYIGIIDWACRCILRSALVSAKVCMSCVFKPHMKILPHAQQ